MKLRTTTAAPTRHQQPKADPYHKCTTHAGSRSALMLFNMESRPNSHRSRFSCKPNELCWREVRCRKHAVSQGKAPRYVAKRRGWKSDALRHTMIAPAISCSLSRRDGNRLPYNRLSALHTHSYICLVSFSRTSDFQDSGNAAVVFTHTLISFSECVLVCRGRLRAGADTGPSEG